MNGRTEGRVWGGYVGGWRRGTKYAAIWWGGIRDMECSVLVAAMEIYVYEDNQGRQCNVLSCLASKRIVKSWSVLANLTPCSAAAPVARSYMFIVVISTEDQLTVGYGPGCNVIDTDYTDVWSKVQWLGQRDTGEPSSNWHGYLKEKPTGPCHPCQLLSFDKKRGFTVPEPLC
jgi:hypothetical protein